MASLKHVDLADNLSNARLEAVVLAPVCLGVHEVGREEGAAPEGTHLRAPPHEVRIGGPLDLVRLLGVEGDQLDVHVTQLDVGVVAVDLLHELGSVGLLRPLSSIHHVVVDPLVVPQTIGVGDPLVGVFGAEDDLRTELPDDLVGIIDVVGVGVRAQVEREVRGGDAMVGHVIENPVGIPHPTGDHAVAQRVARILAVGGADTLGTVDHGEDASRLEQDGIRRTRRRENMNAGGAVRAGEGVDLRVDAVRAFLLGRGRGIVGGFGFLRDRRRERVGRGGNIGVGARRIEVGRLHVAMHVLATCRSGGSGGSEGRDENS